MRFLQILLLIAVIGFGMRLSLGLIHPRPEQESTAAALAVQAPRTIVSESEKAEARNEARILTRNARMEASRQNDNQDHTPVQFPSLEQIVHEQVGDGLLLASVGSALLAENSRRDASTRLRVGYICQPRRGLPFPVITDDEIDQSVRNSDDPAGMTLGALGLAVSRHDNDLETSTGPQ